MIDKTNTEGMKLYIGGEEVTRDFVERAMVEYKQKIKSEEYKKQLEKFADFMKPAVEKKTNSSYKYYRLSVPPYTIYKLKMDDFTSYKFHENQKCWIEFPTFLVDFEYGNIRVDEIEINDVFPMFSAGDLSNGRQR